MGYAKLFSTITESSLWSEPKEVRLLFVTMLAKANSVGFVEASIPGLSRAANLTIEEVERSIPILENPDPYSKNPDCEGRRIIPAPGGWVVLNYEEYRSRQSEEERREYMRDYMKRYRKQHVNKVNDRKESPSASVSVVSSACKKKEESDGFDLFWSEYPNKQAKIAAKRAWLKIKPEEREEVMRGLKAWKASLSWQKDDGQFIPHPATFLNQRRWEDSPKAAKIKPIYKRNYLPAVREPTDAEFKSAAAIAKREIAKFRDSFKRREDNHASQTQTENGAEA